MMGAPYWDEAATAVIAAFISWIGADVLLRSLRPWGRRRAVVDGFLHRVRIPLIGAFLVVGQRIAIARYGGDAPAREFAELMLELLLIAFGAWLVGVALLGAEEVATRIYKTDVEDNRHARKVRTQINILRRLTTVVVGLVATGVMLMQFEAVRTLGAGLLASAGLASVVVGLAAQTTLANVFAGLQLAFTDALRVDDVVVVEERWGNVVEIGLLAVVVRTWDLKMFLLPSTWFTTNPYENWTRYEAAVIGDVTMDLDWNTPVKQMRTEFEDMIKRSDLWDEKVAVLQVTEAVGSFVQIRILVSAKDGPTLFDLRCDVREHMVEWLRDHHFEALPRIRTGDGRPVRARETLGVGRDEQASARMFSGSPEAEERARGFVAAPDEPEAGSAEQNPAPR